MRCVNLQGTNHLLTVNLGGKNCYLIVYTPFVVSFSVVTFARSR